MNLTPLTTAQTEQFWARVDKTGECWLWIGVTTEKGYGRFSLVNDAGRRQHRAHRVAFTEARGPIPDGLVIDHLCRVRNCVNPDHMELVTPAENTLRGVSPSAIAAARTSCAKGHPYLPETTSMRSDGGGRICLVCRRQIQRLRKRST